MEAAEIIEKSRIREWMKAKKLKTAEGGIYYIVQRAPGDGVIFVDSEDYEKFLRLLDDVGKKFGLLIINFCLVSNYLQLILKIKNKNISLSMKNLFERYADYFNNKYQRKGHVFCGRYKGVYCDNPRYLLALSIYVDLTPCREKLSNQPNNYRWGAMEMGINPGKKCVHAAKEICTPKGKRDFVTHKRYHKLLNQFAGMIFNGKFQKQEGPGNFILRFNKYLFQDRTLENIEEKEIAKFAINKRVIRGKDKQERAAFFQKLKSSGLKNKEIGKILKVSRWTIYRDLSQAKKINRLGSALDFEENSNSGKKSSLCS